MKTPAFYNVVLFDRQGHHITVSERQGMKDAKDEAKYLLSDTFAQSSETTHSALGTAKVAIFKEGEPISANDSCEWDKEHPQHAEWGTAQEKIEEERGGAYHRNA